MPWFNNRILGEEVGVGRKGGRRELEGISSRVIHKAPAGLDEAEG